MTTNINWSDLQCENMTRCTRALRLPAILLVAATVMLSACHGNTNYSPAKAHHTKDGFTNRYAHPPRNSVWKWQWQRWRDGVPADPDDGYQFALIKPDAQFLGENRGIDTLTWLGHDSFLIQLGGVNIMTDPHLTQRASPFSFVGPKRYVPPPLSFEELPHIDVVLISHSHYDHLDLETLRRLSRQEGGPPRFLVGLNLGEWASAKGVANVSEHDWGDVVRLAGTDFHFVPVQHWSARTPWDRNRTLWGAWVIEQQAHRIFFGGDFGYSPDLPDIGEQFGGFDLAMIPVGAYEPRWFMKTMHVNTDEAVQAHVDLRARYSVGMHWGTFRLTDERLDEPPLMLAQSLARAGVPDTEFFLMRHGETRLLEDILMGDPAPASRPGGSRLLKNVASSLQRCAPGAQEPECTEGDHEDSEHRASPDQGRAVVLQQPVREK